MRVGILEGMIMKLELKDSCGPRAVVATVVIPPVGIIKEITMIEDANSWTEKVRFNRFWQKAKKIGPERANGKTVMVEYLKTYTGKYECRLIWP